MNKRARKHLEMALGGNMNIATLKPLALNEIMIDFAKKEVSAINYTRCCKSDSELLKVLGEHIAEQFDHKAEDVIEQLEWKFKNL